MGVCVFSVPKSSTYIVILNKFQHEVQVIQLDYWTIDLKETLNGFNFLGLLYIMN